MDVIDLAESEINNYINGRIQHAKVQKGPKLVPTGECHYCFEEVGTKQLFCDSDCAKDYDREQALRR